jgi:glycosyltransferase involved in cell wall biosynthesis
MPQTLSVALITLNEEPNLARTLASVGWADEIVVVDAGSTDRTTEIAQSRGARVFTEPWAGFGPQKNSALRKCNCDWILSLDADEEVSPPLASEIRDLLANRPAHAAYALPRRNLFLGRWMRRGGYYPDPKLRLFRRGAAAFEERAVHETLRYEGPAGRLQGDLLHHAYPTLAGYLEHMNRYSSLAAGGIARDRPSGVGFLRNIVLNPAATFLYNYGLRGGFLDGREGLLLHLYHSAYVSWKYAKAWEQQRASDRSRAAEGAAHP